MTPDQAEQRIRDCLIAGSNAFEGVESDSREFWLLLYKALMVDHLELSFKLQVSEHELAELRDGSGKRG